MLRRARVPKAPVKKKEEDPTRDASTTRWLRNSKGKLDGAVLERRSFLVNSRFGSTAIASSKSARF